MKWYLVFILVEIQICISMAGEVLYVSPHNLANTSCPSQPCATLNQYLLHNGTLPVVSNVEYHFLPGKHHVPANMILQNLYNFSIIGTVNNSSSPVVLVGCSQSYVIKITDSYFVTITNVIFRHCDTPVVTATSITNVHVICCFSCTVENVTFLKYGFTGINLIGESYLHKINVEAMQFTKQCCNFSSILYLSKPIMGYP